MRFIFLAIFTLLCGFNGFAQEKKNEIRLNLLNSLMGSVEGQYEHSLTDNSSVGVNVGLGYGGENSAFNTIINATPTYRMYFGKKHAQGVFIEASTRFSYDEKWGYLNNSYDYQKIGNTFNFGIGAGVGWKWVTSQGLVGSLKTGIGRYITDGVEEHSIIYPNLEISIGKRF